MQTQMLDLDKQLKETTAAKEIAETDKVRLQLEFDLVFQAHVNLV
jgi:hypothetical protein